MNARRKMPDGQRDTSSRSSASKSATLIFVLAEMDERAIRRRSRSRRKRLPKVSSIIGAPRLMFEQPPADRQVSRTLVRENRVIARPMTMSADENHEPTREQHDVRHW